MSLCGRDLRPSGGVVERLKADDRIIVVFRTGIGVIGRAKSERRPTGTRLQAVVEVSNYGGFPMATEYNGFALGNVNILTLSQGNRARPLGFVKLVFANLKCTRRRKRDIDWIIRNVREAIGR